MHFHLQTTDNSFIDFRLRYKSTTSFQYHLYDNTNNIHMNIIYIQSNKIFQHNKTKLETVQLKCMYH